MVDPNIHHFTQLLKELENDIGRLGCLMHQILTVAENLRCKYLMINETYAKWCANVRK